MRHHDHRWRVEPVDECADLLIDGEGHPVVSAVEDRMIGVSLDQMRGKEMALLVAAGPGRARPARAAMKGGFVTHLATSAQVAEDLMEMI